MTPSPSNFLRATCALTLLLPLVIATAHAQSAVPPQQRFEVASIRQRLTTPNEPSDRHILPGGHFTATATPVSTLIRIAFGTDSVSGAPGWAGSETFDINATTANHAEITDPQQFQELILSLLEDRFQFKFHRVPKEASIYWLVLDKPGKPGPALKPATPGAPPSMNTNSTGSMGFMKASGTSMSDLAAALTRQAGRPVEDHTSLKGIFDFQIEWTTEETPDSTTASLFTVLKEQLGLKLQPAKGTTETIVIDQLNHPSAN